MPMVINSNIDSLKSQRNLSRSQVGLSQSMERLSSGLRINSAKDDAAGSTIVSVLTSKVRGMDQAARNTNDGISMLQTAEGALAEISSALQRMRELSLQSANGTYTTENRAALNAEVQQLIKEIDHTSKTTNFNGINPLNGSAVDVDLQVGADLGQTINVSIRQIDADTLGISDTAGLGSFQRKAYDDPADIGMPAAISRLPGLKSGDLIINGIAIGGAIASADTASSIAKDKSTIAIAAAINAKSAETNVKAVVEATTVGGGTMGPSNFPMSGIIQINGVDIELQVAANDTAATRASITKAINLKSGETGVVAIDTGRDESGITLRAEDGRNIAILNSFAGMYYTGLDVPFPDGFDFGNSLIATGTMTLVSMDGKDMRIDTSPLGSAENAGFFVGTYSGSKTSIVAENSLEHSFFPMNTGDISINGVPVPGASVYPKDRVAAINSVSNQTGVVAFLGENRAVNRGNQGTTSGVVSGNINGVNITNFTTQAGAENTSANRTMFVKAVNAISGQTGVIAIDTGVDGTVDGGGVVLVAKDGRTINASMSNGNLAGFVSPGIVPGKYVLQSDREIVISTSYPIGSLSAPYFPTTGFRDGTYGGGRGGQSLLNIDISTVEGANKAVKAIDNALNRVGNVRSNIGAYNNRLEFTINNLASMSQNAASSRSRIEDADFAAETANLSKSQVIQQASTAMLAQANSSAQQVLSLLQN